MPVNNLMLSDIREDDASSGEEEFEVDEILEVRVLEDGTEEFKVRWKNYGSEDDTWEPKENLGGAKDALDKFLKGKKRVKKTPKKLQATKGTKAQKRGPGGNVRENREGEDKRSSDEGESDDDFSVISPASKRKKSMEKKSKKPSAGRGAASGGRLSRPTPHNGDSLTMAISRRMNLGQHSSWLDSGSESESNSTTTKKRGSTEGGGERGKGRAAERVDGEKLPKENGTTENGTKMATGDNDDAGRISDDSTATEKLANSPSPHFDNEARVDGDELNMPSEHDPLPANLLDVLNGTEIGSKESSMSERLKKSNERGQGTRLSKGTNANRNGQTPTTSKFLEDIRFDGVYLDNNGMLKFVVGEDKQRVLTFEEAKDANANALCDYLYGMVEFTKKGEPQIHVTQQQSIEMDEPQEGKSQTRDDDKLDFDY